MPTFAFRCSRCKHEFDVMRAVADRDRFATCPECGAGAFRVFTGCAIRQPCKDWGSLTARDFLGRDQKSEKVYVTKGMAKPIVR